MVEIYILRLAICQRFFFYTCSLCLCWMRWMKWFIIIYWSLFISMYGNELLPYILNFRAYGDFFRFFIALQLVISYFFMVLNSAMIFSINLSKNVSGLSCTGAIYEICENCMPFIGDRYLLSERSFWSYVESLKGMNRFVAWMAQASALSRSLLGRQMIPAASLVQQEHLTLGWRFSLFMGWSVLEVGFRCGRAEQGWVFIFQMEKGIKIYCLKVQKVYSLTYVYFQQLSIKVFIRQITSPQLDKQIMSQSSSHFAYNLQEISGNTSLQQLCEKQQKLILMLHKQVNTLKEVIMEMESDINKYESTLRQLSQEYSVQYKGLKDLSEILPQIKIRVGQLLDKQSKTTITGIQFRQVIKEVPVFIEKQIQIIKQVQKPIFVQKIRQVEKPVFVQKIIQMPCSSCQLASHKRIKT